MILSSKNKTDFFSSLDKIGLKERINKDKSVLVKVNLASPYSKNHHEAALNLVLSVFMKYEACDYSQEGIDTFKAFINNPKSIESLEFYGAYLNDEIIGVIATRDNGNHIALFFVDGKYHRQGIGRKLFEVVLNKSIGNKITVNSSPYAVEIYKKLGFVPDTDEQIKDGIRFIPMTYTRFIS